MISSHCAYVQSGGFFMPLIPDASQVEKGSDNLFRSALRKMRENRPLVHVISNYVTLNDVVNVILAAGGTAIAADDPQETARIASISQALYLNTGMPSGRKLEAMLAAGKEANKEHIPVVLDPVGAGASDFRRLFLTKLLSEVQISCIRGNAAEMAALSGIRFASRGVESADVEESEESLQKLAGRLHCILAVTGEEDQVVTENGPVLVSHTGAQMAKRITGCGCMLSGLIAAFLAACPDTEMGTRAMLVHQVLEEYGKAQELAETRANEIQGGTMTFRNELIDTISRW